MKKLTWRKDSTTNEHHLEVPPLRYGYVYQRGFEWVASVPMASAVKVFDELREAKIWTERLVRRKLV